MRQRAILKQKKSLLLSRISAWQPFHAPLPPLSSHPLVSSLSSSPPFSFNRRIHPRCARNKPTNRKHTHAHALTHAYDCVTYFVRTRSSKLDRVPPHQRFVSRSTRRDERGSFPLSTHGRLFCVNYTRTRAWMSGNGRGTVGVSCVVPVSDSVQQVRCIEAHVEEKSR